MRIRVYGSIWRQKESTCVTEYAVVRPTQRLCRRCVVAFRRRQNRRVWSRDVTRWWQIGAVSTTERAQTKAMRAHVSWQSSVHVSRWQQQSLPLTQKIIC